ncbi:MAG TPA: SpoIIE family protein phosphatase [Tepidisphaeraceae bacterium]|jgi:serine phosphatase RsbU (regulator of sigma subunit)
MTLHSVAHAGAGETRRMLLRVGHAAMETLSVPLTRTRMVLGRAQDVDLPLDSHKVSRRHAELIKDPFDRWWVRDLASRNGTRVNGSRVAESLLQPGDVLEVGDFVLTLQATVSQLDARVSQTDAQVSIFDEGAGGGGASLAGERVSRLREFAAVGKPQIGHAHLAAVVEFGHALNVTQDATERLRRLCALMLSDTFRGRSVTLLRVPRDRPEGAQVIFGPQRAEPALDTEPPPISASVLRAVCATPEAVLATNVSAGPDKVLLSMPVDQMALSVVAVPLGYDERAADVLYMAFAPECGHNDWLALVDLAVRQYLQAESVWQNVGKIKEYAAIQRELERAQEIQQRLIPRRVRITGVDAAIGFRPCLWVGGDYADIVPMADGRVLLAVADVCGKGLSAALVASSLHTMVHAAVRAGESLVELMGALNEYFRVDLGIESFATMLCVALDPATGACESACAGHPPGLIVDRKAKVRPLQVDLNCPLGVEAVPIRTARDRLGAGELLALFTDGVTELANDANEMLGSAGLGDGLGTLYAAGPDGPVSELVEQMNCCLDRYEGSGGIANDDRTFLLARLRGGAGGGGGGGAEGR